jgi:hypothetical protein
MTQFSTTQIEAIELITGHSIATDLVVREQLSSDYTQTTVDRVVEILAELTSLELLLKEARETSFVTESRGSKLSYSQHIKHLRLEASNLVKELAYITKINVEFNKYNSSKKATTSYW